MIKNCLNSIKGIIIAVFYLLSIIFCRQLIQQFGNLIFILQLLHKSILKMSKIQTLQNLFEKFQPQKVPKITKRAKNIHLATSMTNLQKKISHVRMKSQSKQKESRLVKTWQTSKMNNQLELKLKKIRSCKDKEKSIALNQSLNSIKDRMHNIQMKISKITDKSLKLNAKKDDNLKLTGKTRQSQNSLNKQKNPKNIKSTLSAQTVQNFDINLNLQLQSLKTSRNLINLQINNKNQVFQIIKYIDEGSYGKVSLVQHLQSNSVFCLKIIKRSRLNQCQQNQLSREIHIQSFINHPNIVKLYTFSSDSENIYLLLEACIGENLFKKLSRESISEKEVKCIIKQVCSAIKYMHQNKIIHRDIKPENILLSWNTVKICDFGWAIHSFSLRKTSCGTPLYYSPEMLKKQLYDSKTDIWCLGMLTYELLTGNIPFKIETINELIKIIEDEVQFKPDLKLSEQAMNFVLKCLTKDPLRRYDIDEALDDEFLRKSIPDQFRNTIA